MQVKFLFIQTEDYEELISSVVLTVDIKKYNLYKDFFNEINETIHILKDKNLLRIEINMKLFSNINFLLILLFDKSQNSNLPKFIEEFTLEDGEIREPEEKLKLPASSNSFKMIRKSDDDELSSQYSTLSSILGLQVSLFFFTYTCTFLAFQKN